MGDREQSSTGNLDQMTMTAPDGPRSRTDSAIPVIDIGPYRAGVPNARESVAAELRDALEQVGFFVMVGHGVPQSLIDQTFSEARRFHDLPLAAKMTLKMNEHNNGYMAMGRYAVWTSDVNANDKPDLNEAFFCKRERGPDDSLVRAGRRFAGPNQWPVNLPGFRDVVLAYTDADYMTFLAQSDVPGLQVRMPDATWVDVPYVPGSFAVNSGDMMQRWTNHRFKSTPHRALPPVGRPRYAIPYFMGPHLDTEIVCLSTCQGPGNPPRHPPITYAAYLDWWYDANYNAARQRDVA